MVRVLLTMQKTSTAAMYLKNAGLWNSEFRCSNPPFNERNEPLWNIHNITNFNIPVYGVLIPAAVATILENRTFVAHCHAHDIYIPNYEFNLFCQSKIDTIRGVSTQIDEFADAIENLTVDDIKSTADWNNFMRSCGFPQDWSSNLHHDDLRKMFNIEHVPKWLPKNMMLWNLKGCLTDIVNMVFMLQDIKPDNAMTEQEISNVITVFAGRLTRKDFRMPWMPDVLVEDEESDDVFTRGILTYMNPDLKVIVQLPKVNGFDDLDTRLSNSGYEVFRDHDSKNAQAIRLICKDAIFRLL